MASTLTSRGLVSNQRLTKACGFHAYHYKQSLPNPLNAEASSASCPQRER